MRWGPLLQIVLGEQQARQTRRSNAISLKTARVTLAVAALSGVLSLAAAGLGLAALLSSSTWETRQLAILGKLREDVAAVRTVAERPQPIPPPPVAPRGAAGGKAR